MSDRKRVWEDFDVDDDPTAFPDPFSSNTQIPISDELQEKRDMFGFRPPEIRKGSGQSLSFNSAAPREASYGQNPESRQNRWQGGSRSAREVSFLVPSQNPIGGSASASSPRHSLNSTGGLLPSAPRVVVSDQDSASASTSSYDGTRNRGFVEPRIGSGGRSSFSVDDDSRPSLNRRLPLTSTIQRPLPPSWRVPDSGTYKGYLFRYKGKWKKQWAKELFTIQHNVVLICPKETPFLIKHCIPLINIIKVDPDSNDSLKFTITYLAPLKKGRSRAEEILCRAETAAECSDWVSQLTNAQRRALLKKNPIADFIERDAAEKTLRSAYRNLRGAGGHILASVAAQVIQINRERNLRDAFTIWRSWAQKDKLKAADKKLAAVETEVKEKTMKLEADLRVAQTHAKKERTMFLAVDRLKNYQRFLLHLSLMRLKRNADAFVTENMAAGAASLMQFNWRKQAEYLAQDLVTYRAKKLKNLITGLRYSRLKDAFHRMRVFGTLSHQTNVYRDQALFALVMQQADAHSMQKRFVFEKWKSYQALAIKQEEGLLRALQIEQRRQLAGIVKLWLINMNKIKTRQATALARMDAAFVKVESRQLSSAFRGLVHYADEQANLDTLQVASNFGVLNSKLVKSFAKLPLHRGCIIFVACVKKAHTVRLAHSFSKLQRNACRKSYYGRAVEVLGSMYNSLEKRHLLLRAFVTIHCHGFRSASLRVMRKAALTQLECLMKSSITSNLCAAFNRWRSTAMLQNVHLEKSRWYANLQGVLARGRMSQMEVFAEKCSYWVAKLTKRRLFIGLRRIQLHCEKCKLVRNMARIYLVQRVVQLIDRLRVARLTQAWDMLRLMFSDTQEYYATKREMALGAIRQSTHTSRIVKRRKELQSRLETLVEDSLSSLNSSKPPELPQFDETRVIPALHKKVKSITYKVKQPLYKKRPHAPPQRIRSRLLKRRGAVLRAPRASQPMIVMPRPHFPTPVLSEGDSSSLFTQDSQQHIPREQLSAAVRRALDEADRYLNSAASQESFRLGHGGGNVPRSAEYILHQSTGRSSSTVRPTMTQQGRSVRLTSHLPSPPPAYSRPDNQARTVVLIPSPSPSRPTSPSVIPTPSRPGRPLQSRKWQQRRQYVSPSPTQTRQCLSPSPTQNMVPSNRIHSILEPTCFQIPSDSFRVAVSPALTIASSNSFVETNDKMTEYPKSKTFVESFERILPNENNFERDLRFVGSIAGASVDLSDLNTLISELAGRSILSSSKEVPSPRRQEGLRVLPSSLDPLSLLDDLSTEDFLTLQEVVDTDTIDWRLLQDFLREDNIVSPA